MNYFKTIADTLAISTMPPGELSPAIQVALEDAYREGYADAVRNYAVWSDGVQWVGVMRRPLKAVLDEVSKSSLPIRY